MAALFVGKKYIYCFVVHPCHKYCVSNIICVAFSSRGRPPSRDGVSSWLCSGAAAGGREAGQGWYCVKINHIKERKQACWLTSLNCQLQSFTTVAILLDVFYLSTSDQLLAKDSVLVLTSRILYFQSRRNLHIKLD